MSYHPATTPPLVPTTQGATAAHHAVALDYNVAQIVRLNQQWTGDATPAVPEQLLAHLHAAIIHTTALYVLQQLY